MKRRAATSKNPGHDSTPRRTERRAWRIQRPSGRLIALGLVHGLLFAMAFPPSEWWWTVFIGPAIFAVMARQAPSGSAAFIAAFLTQALMWLWLNRWITQVTPPGYVLLSLYMAFWPALLAVALQRLSVNRLFKTVPQALMLPIFWVSMDFLRGDVVLGGYPWFTLGNPLINWLSVAQVADLVGVHGCGFLVAACSGALVDAFASNRAAGLPRSTLGSLGAVLAVIAALVAAVGYGSWRLRQSASSGSSLSILAIQTNLPQSNKIAWTPEAQERDVAEFIALTRQAVAAADSSPDLVVWPETMLPSLGYEPETIAALKRFGEAFAHLLRWPSVIESLAADLGVPMLVGTEAWIGTTVAPLADGRSQLTRQREYNSAYLVQGDRPHQRYDKVVLTPFGERMPLFSNWEWMEQALLSVGAPGMAFNLDAATEIRRLELDTGQGSIRFATPICFEDTVSWLCRAMAWQDGRRRIAFFLSISNDGWFGWSAADRLQHVQVARWRCIENRVPMVRCVNTGLSVNVDSCGRVIGAVGNGRYGEAGMSGWLEAQVQGDSRSPWFVRAGWMMPWMCLMLALVILGTSFFVKGRNTP